MVLLTFKNGTGRCDNCTLTSENVIMLPESKLAGITSNKGDHNKKKKKKLLVSV